MKFIIKPAMMALVATTAARNPALGGSINVQGLQNAKNVAVPFIFKYLKDIKIPKIDISGGSFTDLDIKIDQPALNNVNLSLHNQFNSVEMKASSVNAHATANFTFKVAFFKVSGSADITIKDIGVDAELALSEQNAKKKGDMAPKIDARTLNVNVNPDNVNISLKGGLVSKIANILIPLIKSSVIPQVIGIVQSTVKQQISKTVNPDLAKYGSSVDIPYLAGLNFDFAQMKGGPTVTSDSILELQMDGTFTDSNHPEVYSITPAAFPIRETSGLTAQGHLTDYVLNTLMKAALDTGNAIDISKILSGLGQTITTDEVGVAFPQILTKYGSGKACSISAGLVKSAGVAAFTGNVDSISDLYAAVVLKVGNETAIEATLNAAGIAGLLNAKSGKLYGNFSTHTIGTVSDFKTTLGLTQDSFETQLQAFVDASFTKINSDLKAGSAIPTIMGIDVSDLELNTSNGWVEAGINVTPKTFLDLQDAWGSYKEEVDRIDAGFYKTQKWGSMTFNESEGLFLQ